MPIINYVTKEIQFKVVVYGPPQAGKTTTLKYLHSQIEAARRSEMVTRPTGADKTIFFDFELHDVVLLESFKTKVEMYTVPGAVTLNVPWQLVLRDVDGVLFVVDSQWEQMEENVESLKKLEENLEKQQLKLDEVPLALAYNKRDLTNVAPVNYLEFLLNNRQERVPSFETVASNGDSVLAAINELTQLILHRFSDASLHKPGGIPFTGVGSK